MGRMASEQVNTLCCCEYENYLGERSHMLACCCDCQAVDEACDRCITCRPVNDSTMKQVMVTLSDRCRIPGLTGHGAIKLRLDVAAPVIMVPVFLMSGTLGLWTTILILFAIPVFILTFYRVWKQTGHLHTLFFFVWGVMSVMFCLFVFAVVVMAYRKLLMWECLLFVSSIVLMFYYLIKLRNNPSYLRTHSEKAKDEHEYKGKHVPNGDSSHSVGDVVLQMNGSVPGVTQNTSTKHTSPDILEQSINWVEAKKGDKGDNFCKSCNMQRLPRSGHCPVCKTCIILRDHHCVWVDSCIGAKNHHYFLAAMILFIFNGLYGSHLALTTICTPEMYFDWLLLPLDCRFIYTDFQTSLAFVCVCYTLAATSMMAVGLLHQILLISQNVTSQELHQAAVVKGRTILGLFVLNNPNNEGLLRNWTQFLFGSRSFD